MRILRASSLGWHLNTGVLKAAGVIIIQPVVWFETGSLAFRDSNVWELKSRGLAKGKANINQEVLM